MVEKTIKTKKIYKGEILELRVDDIILENGKTGKREIIEHGGAVTLIPITPEGKIVLVKQFRKPIEKEILELPAGRIEKGEDPKNTAIRELKEETGYEIKDIKYLFKFAPALGYSNEIIYVYLSHLGVKGDTNFDETEDIEIFEYPLDEILNLIYKGDEILDGKTVMLLEWLKNHDDK